jgi:hypothetical protein
VSANNPDADLLTAKSDSNAAVLFLRSMISTSLLSMFEEEDQACGFLHVGSGWKASPDRPGESIAEKIFSACLEADQLLCAKSNFNRNMPPSRFECKAPKTCGGLLHRQNSNRSEPYTRDNKIGSRDCERLLRAKSITCLESCRKPAPPVPSCNQADFENLSLGPGFPCFDAADLHI